MSDSIPISLGAIETRQAQKEAKELIAQQVTSEARFEESVDEGFNPIAAQKQQQRLNKFKPLDSRGKTLAEAKEKKILEVSEKAETQDDLAREFNKRNPELDGSKLTRLKRNLREGMTADQVLADVEDAFIDPMLVDEALEYLERAAPDPIKEAVRGARTTLSAEKGREIIAGRNIAPMVQSYHNKGLGKTPTELRNLYREVTGNPRDHNVLFSELSNKYPFDQLKNIVAFLLKSLGYDLKSKGPSIQQAELMRLMTETRNLQSILWVYLFFKSRMKLMRSLFDKHGIKLTKVLTFEMLAKEFIRLVEERYPSVLKLLKQVEKFGLQEDSAKAIVIMQYRDAIRQLSMRLYKTTKQRQDLLMVILETLEELEEDEDEDEEKEEKK